MWSNSSRFDNLICVLLFLFAIGFLNEASTIIVIITVLLIWKDGLQLRFKDFFSFGTLVLFAVFYFMFATQVEISAGLKALGCPIAFYIGSNMIGNNLKNARKCILLIAFGMAMHVVLNYVFELARYGISVHSASLHYDIWSGKYIAATGAMTNAVMIIGCLFYLLFHEKRKFIRYTGLFFLVFVLVYGIMLGSRTTFIILLISSVVGIVVSLAMSGNFEESFKQILRLVGVALSIVVLFGIIYLIFKDEIINFLKNSYLIHRIEYAVNKGEPIFSTERWNIRSEYYKHLLDYPWGGKKLYSVVGSYAHELWFDIWDMGGVLPTIMMFIYTIRSFWRHCAYILSPDTPFADKVLLSSYTACIFAQFFAEPVLSGAPILLYAYCLIDGTLAKEPERQGYIQ